MAVIYVNNETFRIESNITLKSLINRINQKKIVKGTVFMVKINNKYISPRAYDDIQVCDGDRISVYPIIKGG